MFCIVHGSDPSHILDDWNEGQLTSPFFSFYLFIYFSKPKQFLLCLQIHKDTELVSNVQMPKQKHQNKIHSDIHRIWE